MRTEKSSPAGDQNFHSAPPAPHVAASAPTFSKRMRPPLGALGAGRWRRTRSRLALSRLRLEREHAAVSERLDRIFRQSRHAPVAFRPRHSLRSNLEVVVRQRWPDAHLEVLAFRDDRALGERLVRSPEE